MARSDKNITFDEWAKAVDAEICRLQKTARNEVEARYSEMYLRGFSVAKAVREALASTGQS